MVVTANREDVEVEVEEDLAAASASESKRLLLLCFGATPIREVQSRGTFNRVSYRNGLLY